MGVRGLRGQGDLEGEWGRGVRGEGRTWGGGVVPGSEGRGGETGRGSKGPEGGGDLEGDGGGGTWRERGAGSEGRGGEAGRGSKGP